MDWDIDIDFAAMNVHHYAATNRRGLWCKTPDFNSPWWRKVTSCKPSGTQRCNVEIGLRFYCPIGEGVTASWSVDFEPHSANGTSQVQFDMALIRKVLDAVPTQIKAQIKNWAHEGSVKVREGMRGTEDWLAKTRAIADSLESV